MSLQLNNNVKKLPPITQGSGSQTSIKQNGTHKSKKGSLNGT